MARMKREEWYNIARDVDRQVEIVDDIPKSATGETLRAELRARESARLRGQRQSHPREL